MATHTIFTLPIADKMDKPDSVKETPSDFDVRKSHAPILTKEPTVTRKAKGQHPKGRRRFPLTDLPLNLKKIVFQNLQYDSLYHLKLTCKKLDKEIGGIQGKRLMFLLYEESRLYNEQQRALPKALKNTPLPRPFQACTTCLKLVPAKHMPDSNKGKRICLSCLASTPAGRKQGAKIAGLLCGYCPDDACKKFVYSLELDPSFTFQDVPNLPYQVQIPKPDITFIPERVRHNFGCRYYEAQLCENCHQYNQYDGCPLRNPNCMFRCTCHTHCTIPACNAILYRDQADNYEDHRHCDQYPVTGCPWIDCYEFRHLHCEKEKCDGVLFCRATGAGEWLFDIECNHYIGHHDTRFELFITQDWQDLQAVRLQQAPEFFHQQVPRTPQNPRQPRTPRIFQSSQNRQVYHGHPPPQNALPQNNQQQYQKRQTRQPINGHRNNQVQPGLLIERFSQIRQHNEGSQTRYNDNQGPYNRQYNNQGPHVYQNNPGQQTHNNNQGLHNRQENQSPQFQQSWRSNRQPAEYGYEMVRAEQSGKSVNMYESPRGRGNGRGQGRGRGSLRGSLRGRGRGNQNGHGENKCSDIRYSNTRLFSPSRTPTKIFT